MLFRSFVASFIVAASIFTALPAPAAAQGGGEHIAVLNLEAIRRDAASVKDIRKQIGQYRAAFQAEIQKEEKALRDANQELARRRSILSPDAFAKERQKFEQRVLNMQKQVQERRQQLEQVKSEAMKQVEDKLNAIVRDIAKKQGFSLVLSGVQAVVLDERLDITKEVLDRLNKSLPAVKVPKPESKPGK